jgi:hypothetical protein
VEKETLALLVEVKQRLEALASRIEEAGPG